MMWGDIIIGMHGQEPFTRAQAAELPAEMQMVFWNYSHFDESFYRETVREYRHMGFEPIIAPGVWNWGRLWGSRDCADGTAARFVRAAAREGIREALVTMWGDDGNETPFGASWPALCQFANLCWDPDTPRKSQTAQVRSVCGTEAEVYALPGRLDQFPGKERTSIRSFSNLSKAILWDDPILGTFCTHLARNPLGRHYQELAAAIRKESQSASRTDGVLFAYACALADVVAVKADLNARARQAYASRDRRGMERVAVDATALARLTSVLQRRHTAVWLGENKPFGLEVLQGRYGGQILRLQEMTRIVRAWVKGNVSSIPEWEERPQKIWKDPAAVRVAWANVVTNCYVRGSR